MDSGNYIRKSVESIEYDFIREQGLVEENKIMKDAINEVLELLNGGNYPNIEWIKNRLNETIKK